ncbi:hypothetical protein [Hymenobacter sp.]|uniref:hypothetical protein n=1 Tax=Hymenobacter sp. TaxID=1898978 RepID=UPI002ED81B85
MKLLFFLLVFLLDKQSAFSQDYLLNGSFEHKNGCPTDLGEIYLAKEWFGNEETPDYFNKCSEAYHDSIDVLHNFVGYRKAHSGNAQAGLCLLHYSRGINIKKNYLINEMIFSKFKTPLIKGDKFSITLFASLADSSNIFSDSIYISFFKNKPVLKNKKVVNSNFIKVLKLRAKITYGKH